METPKKTYGKQGGRPKVSIGRIRKYVVSTRLSPERKLRFSALCREAGQPPAEVLRRGADLCRRRGDQGDVADLEPGRALVGDLGVRAAGRQQQHGEK